jgi:hypothetical protein
MEMFDAEREIRKNKLTGKGLQECLHNICKIILLHIVFPGNYLRISIDFTNAK